MMHALHHTDQCDFSHEGNAPAVDSHAGEVFYCEDHRALVLKAFESGVLDDPSYTIEGIEAMEGEAS